MQVSYTTWLHLTINRIADKTLPLLELYCVQYHDHFHITIFLQKAWQQVPESFKTYKTEFLHGLVNPTARTQYTPTE
jgi:hypothetical protein